MTVNEIKDYIRNEQNMTILLNAIGCHHVVFHKSKNYFTCGNPDGDNSVAITVKLNSPISVRDYTREDLFPVGSNIFTLVGFCLGIRNEKNSFYHVMKYIHELFGLELNYYKKIKTNDEKDNVTEDPLYFFKKIRRKRLLCVSNDLDVKSIKQEFYYPFPHIDFVREGIMPWTWDKFSLGYSYATKRTVIPLRFWLTGELLGYNMRTSISNPELLGIRKYLITTGYPKGINIFGLWEHKESIEKAGYVVVYEAEKSVLIRDSLFDETGVAVQGHSISSEQAKILIGLNVEIIIAFDKDVEKDYVRYCCENFYQIRRVSYLYDDGGLLKEKDSPVDCGNEVFQKMLKERTVYDTLEHIKYLASVGANKL